jgi:hypothetical protein
MMVEHGSLLQNAVEHETNTCCPWPITNWHRTTRTSPNRHCTTKTLKSLRPCRLSQLFITI